MLLLSAEDILLYHGKVHIAESSHQIFHVIIGIWCLSHGPTENFDVSRASLPWRSLRDHPWWSPRSGNGKFGFSHLIRTNALCAGTQRDWLVGAGIGFDADRSVWSNRGYALLKIWHNLGYLIEAYLSKDSNIFRWSSWLCQHLQAPHFSPLLSH